jgi:hypothetical protein
LTVSPAVAAPGQAVTVTGDERLSGDLTIEGPEGTAARGASAKGTGTLTVPAGAADGVYEVRLATDGDVRGVAVLRVSRAPGIWLSADRRFAGQNDDTTLTVTALGIDPTSPVEIVGIDDEGGDDAVLALTRRRAVRIPTGTEPPLTLERILAGPITMPGRLASVSLVIRAAGVESNHLTGENCEEPGTVKGAVAEPSLVKAVWIEGGLRQAMTTADGEWELEAGPGTVLVTTRPTGDLGGAAPEWRAEQVDCPIEDPNPAEVGDLGGGDTSGLLGRADSPGGSDAPCRRVMVVPAGKGGDLDRLFVDVVATDLDQALERASVFDSNAALSLLEFEQLRQLLGADDESAGADFLEALAGAFATDFLVVVGTGEVGAETTLSLSAIRVKDLAVVSRQTDRNADAGALLSSAATRRLTADMGKAAVCGDADPTEKAVAPGKEAKLTYTVTDLTGTGADGAEVTVEPASPKCGSLDPAKGTAEGGTFETTYTAKARQPGECTDELQWSARWPDGKPGAVETRKGEASTRITVATWELEMEFHVVDDASTVRSLIGRWNGLFGVDDGELSGSGEGTLDGAANCLRDNSVKVSGPHTFAGTWTFRIEGSASGGEFHLDAPGAGTTVNIRPYPTSANAAFCALMIYFGEQLMPFFIDNIVTIATEGGYAILPARSGASKDYTGPDGSGLKVTIRKP